MKIAEFDCNVGGEPIWRYERKNGVFFVRIRGKCINGTNHYVIKSPTGKLYSFYEYSGSENDAINNIIDGKAEGEEYFCGMDSIYEE